jgi:hypothetical protein
MRLISWTHPHGSETVYFKLGAMVPDETRQEKGIRKGQRNRTIKE